MKLYKDSKQALECETDWDIVRYIHNNHSCSISHAMKYEGYTVKDADGKDITNQFK